MKYENRDELIEKAKELRAEGLSYRKIAKAIGVRSGHTILRWLNPNQYAEHCRKNREYYYSNKEKVLAYSTAYREAHPDRIKKRDAVYYQKNKAKISAKQKIYNKEHIEEINGYHTRYRAIHKDEIRERGHRRRVIMQTGEAIKKEQYDRIWEEQEGRCFYCDKPMLREGTRSDSDYYNIEHINPANNGGFHTITNIVYICAECNWKKNDRLIEDWMPEALPKIAANPRLRYDIEEAHMRWLV